MVEAGGTCVTIHNKSRAVPEILVCLVNVSARHSISSMMPELYWEDNYLKSQVESWLSWLKFSAAFFCLPGWIILTEIFCGFLLLLWVNAEIITSIIPWIFITSPIQFTVHCHHFILFGVLQLNQIKQHCSITLESVYQLQEQS